jgi:hypothetical protein
MEGNLTRARSSMYITPSSSMSSIHSSSPLTRSTPSPAEGEHRIINGLGAPPAKHRQIKNISIPPNGSPHHSRVLSENAIPNALRSPSYSTSNISTGFQVNNDLESKEHPHHNFSKPLSQASNYRGAPIEPLSETETTPPRDYVRSSTADPYSQPSSDHRGLTRSASSMQMRDLTEKMKDLKGKISTLRDRARDDNMKRRSMQSLRTPSPFTAAEQWYTGSKGHSAGMSLDAGVAQGAWDEASMTKSVDGRTTPIASAPNEAIKNERLDDRSGYEDVEEVRGHDATIDHVALSAVSEQDEEYGTADEGEEVEQVGEEESDNKRGDEDYVDELVESEEAEDYESEGDESLYHDSLTVAISHEDREDAFDYEHFFLHSAMGTLSQDRNGRRDSVGSYSSEDSVETTRGPEAPGLLAADDRTAQGHLRNSKSMDSVSTMETFATAQETNSEDLESRDDYIEAEEAPLASLDRPETPQNSKRSTFGTPTKLPLEQQIELEKTSRPSSVLRGGQPVLTDMHRPSVSSFNSTGTTRSFPLVNKPKSSSQTPEPVLNGAGRLHAASRSVDSLGLAFEKGGSSSPVHMLVKDDQILVERLVASLGKCVLGLQDVPRGSTEGRMWRRRLETARRVLEGVEPPM